MAEAIEHAVVEGRSHSTPEVRDTRITNRIEERVIEPDAFVADTAAFVDVRIERSHGKASYSFIGPGVSQNADQVVNITEPHGFNVGAATLPHGAINNPHLHFTAEVFICTRGSFKFSIGEHGGQDLQVDAGTVFSVPTWSFRSFENIGPDDGWIFAVLGGDDTGGILWAPHIVREAATTGLYLDGNNAVLDAVAGDDVSMAIAPVDPDHLAGHVVDITDAELDARRVTGEQLDWSSRAMLSSVVGGHDVRMAPVIGNGMSQDRRHRSLITNPHGFSLEWLEVGAESTTGVHRHAHTQAMFLIDGSWEVAMELDGEWQTTRPSPGSIVSVPAGAWRSFGNVGASPARAAVVCGSDAPTRLEWSDVIIETAMHAGWSVDAAGYIAPTALIGSGS